MTYEKVVALATYVTIKLNHCMKKKRKWAHDTAHSVGSKSNQRSYQIAVLEKRGERRKVKGQR